MLTICFYFSILFIALFWAYMVEYSGGNKCKEFVYRAILFLTLWLPAVFREGIGTDYGSYVVLFSHSNIGEIEPGFYCICQIVKYLGLDYHWMFAIVALISYFPVCFGLPRKGIWLAVLFFCILFYLNTWSLIRQGAAVCLILWAVCQLLKANRLNFFIIILLASTIHYSALLLLPFYILRNKSLNRMMAIMIVITGIAFIQFFGVIDFLFSSTIFADSHYGKYVTSSFNRETEVGTGLGVLVRLLIPVCMICLLPKLKVNLKGYGFIICLNIAYIFAYCLALQIHIFNRILDLFTFVPILSVGIIGAYTHYKFKSIALFFLIILHLILFYKNIVANPSSNLGGLGIYPYQTFLVN